jgi:hypothetical protein
MSLIGIMNKCQVSLLSPKLAIDDSPQLEKVIDCSILDEKLIQRRGEDGCKATGSASSPKIEHTFYG